MYSRRKIVKSSIYYLCRFRMFTSKMDSCQNNPKKSYAEKKSKHKPSGYSLGTCYSLDNSKTEWNNYRRKDCIEKFCKDLKDQAMKIINHEKKTEIN